MSLILRCEPCRPAFLSPSADFQDKRYGKNMRVMTSTAKGDACCTVCSAKQIGKGEPVPKKKSGTGGGRGYVALPPAEGWPGGVPEKNGWRP